MECHPAHDMYTVIQTHTSSNVYEADIANNLPSALNASDDIDVWNGCSALVLFLFAASQMNTLPSPPPVANVPYVGWNA